MCAPDRFRRPNPTHRPAGATRRALLGTIIPLLFAGPAAAVLIDDFETGPFGLVAPMGQTVGAPTVTASPTHCIAPVRQVNLTSNGPVDAGADLQLTALDDEVTTVFPDGGGELSFRWSPPAPVDLTASGALAAVGVHLGAAEPGATLELTLEDDTGISGSVVVSVTGPGVKNFAYSSYPGSLDLARIAEIVLELRVPSYGDYHFRKIWAKKTTAGLLKFDSLTPLVMFAPFPAPPILFDVAMNDLVPTTPLARLSLVLEAVDHGAPGRADHMDGVLVASDAGGPEGIPGYFAAISLFVSEETPLAADPDRFRLRWMITPDSRTTFAGARLHAPPTVVQETGRVRMQFEVEYVDASGAPVGIYSMHGAHFDLWDGSTCELTAFEITLMDPGPLTGGDAVELETSFQLNATGPVDYSEPVLVLSMDGDHDTVSVGTGAPAVGAGRDPAGSLRALPTVTRSTTELLLDRPAARDTQLDVVDVTGRVVRRLTLPAGRSSITWDGRSGTGASAAAGVYFARVPGSGAGSAARIVRIR